MKNAVEVMEDRRNTYMEEVEETLAQYYNGQLTLDTTLSCLSVEMEEVKTAIEDVQTTKEEEWCYQCKRVLRESFPDQQAQVEEYIGEAEHQDGKVYWSNFDAITYVIDDFKLFIMA